MVSNLAVAIISTSFCMSLLMPANRDRFKADEEAYLSEWNLTEPQKSAVRRRDYNAMIAEGGSIYLLGKIGAMDGKSFVQLAASMTGMTSESYTAMMVRGGRVPDAPLTIPQPPGSDLRFNPRAVVRLALLQHGS
jgi:protocatechuate 4,5-dioxygenase alpha subunit